MIGIVTLISNTWTTVTDITTPRDNLELDFNGTLC